ncbi:MAG: phenylacetate--CoA ligase family protein, partial [Shimia sp.]
MTYFDALETRSQDTREAAQLEALNTQLTRLAAHPGSCLPDSGPLKALAELRDLPVLRKST